MLVVFRFLLSLKKAFLRNTSEWLLPSNLQHSLVEHFVVSSLFQFLMISLEFTDHFPGSNKVHYPISDVKILLKCSRLLWAGKITLTYDA